MPRTLARLAAIAAAAGCAACAPAEQEPETIAGLSTERQCLFTRDIDGYGDAPDGPRGDRLYVDTSPNDRWLFETFGVCPELDWSLRIALDTRPMSTLCTGDLADLLVPDGLGGRPERCPVRLLGKMSEPG